MPPFDIENFIIEIRCRPAIWNTKSPEYGDKLLKERAWEEVYILFTEGFEEMSIAQKSQAAVDLQRRWKSLRDSFTRELSSIKRSKNVKPRKKRYVYFQQLSFLAPVSRMKSRRKKPSKTEQKDEVNIVTQVATTSRRRRKEVTSGENQAAQFFPAVPNVTEQERITTLKEDDDADRHFLISLLPYYKMVPKHMKLDLQVEIINLIKKYKLCNPYLKY